jgi:hypothetical protein
LEVERAHERAVATWSLAIVTAVVDDDDEAVEGVADRVGGAAKP